MSPRWLHWPAAVASDDWDTNADGIWELTSVAYNMSGSSANTISASTAFPSIAKFWRVGGTFSYGGGTHTFLGSTADSSNAQVNLGGNAFNTMSFAVWRPSTGQWYANSAVYQNCMYVPAAGFPGNGIAAALTAGDIVVFQTQHVTDVSGWSSYS